MYNSCCFRSLITSSMRRMFTFFQPLTYEDCFKNSRQRVSLPPWSSRKYQYTSRQASDELGTFSDHCTLLIIQPVNWLQMSSGASRGWVSVRGAEGQLPHCIRWTEITRKFRSSFVLIVLMQLCRVAFLVSYNNVKEINLILCSRFCLLLYVVVQ